MLLSPRLKKGDKVYLIAPAGRVSQEKFNKLKIIVENLGLVPVWNENALKGYGYFSAPDEVRLQDMINAFKHPQAKAVFCLRGGYGATRLLNNIPYALIRKNPKVFLGFSDITALQMAFLKKTGLITFHTSLNSLEYDYTAELFKQMVFVPQEVEIPFVTDFHPAPVIIKSGKAHGILVGGNLSLLVSLIGTGFLPRFRNRIVFIEEIKEPPYKIDRMLNHLFMATDIRHAVGIILGIFHGCQWQEYYQTKDFTFSLEEIFEHYFKGINGPVIYNFPLGHVEKISVLPMGAKISIDTNTLSLKVLKPVVK